MHWFKITLLIIIAISTLGHISLIGKERDVITPIAATINTLINSLVLAGIIYYL